MLAKYGVSLPRFSTRMVKPFIGAGPSFRMAYNLNGASPSNHGFPAGVGAEVHVWKLRIAPQVRCVRWARDAEIHLMNGRDLDDYRPINGCAVLISGCPLRPLINASFATTRLPKPAPDSSRS